MASTKTIVAAFLLLALFDMSLGAVHNVGDSAGWTTIGNVDYNKWASSKNFDVGDSLIFQYNNQFHNVKQVARQDFQSCNATSPVATYTSGSDSITLKRAGHYYFLCGVPGHCQAGQKLDVLVSPTSLRPTASPAPLLGKPIDAVAPSPAQSSAPSQYMPLLLLVISDIAFYVCILA